MANEPPGDARFDFSRRTFLENSGLAGGAMLFAGQASDVARGETGSQQASEGDAGVDEEALVHFDVEQARVVQAMAARIFPSDKYGPGAVELGVVYFIDRQLNDAWGRGDDWYMEGPFVNRYEGAIPNQGWQSNLVPAEVYEFALGWIDEYANQRFGSGFLDLANDQQDEVLRALEDDELDNFESIEPSEFFELLQTNVIEGVYCDPTYGGNRDMAGWKMKRFPGSPGALGSYSELIEREEFIRIPPRSVADDVESVGLESGSGGSGEGGSGGSGSGDQQGAVHNHNHGPRYELKGEGTNGDGSQAGSGKREASDREAGHASEDEQGGHDA